MTDAGTARALCRHCGQPAGVAASGLSGADAEAFCCAGCRAAYALIQTSGLTRFYRRMADAGERALRPDPEAAVPDYESFIAEDASGVRSLNLLVEGVRCGACVWLIESVLSRDPAVLSARVNMTLRSLRLSWQGSGDAQADAGARLAAVIALGYRLQPFEASAANNPEAAPERALLRALAVAGFATANVMLLSVAIWAGHTQGMGLATRDLLHWVSALIALPAVAYAGRPFFASALAALIQRRVNMDVPISLAVILAAAISLAETIAGGADAYFDSAVTLLFFLLVGRYLDVRARGRARARVRHLAGLAGAAVTQLAADGTRRQLAPSRVRPGMRVFVAAGERIGVDGVIETGTGTLDLSAITGESLPQTINVGGRVFAGALNLGGALTVRAEAAGEATLLADIARRFEAAIEGRSRYVALADRIARLYAPVVHIAALVAFIGWLLAGAQWSDALLIAISVLIITCPCALALAIPAVNVVAVGRLLRGGVLVKDATALERLAEATHVAFDKTGTLTLGRPELLDSATQPAESLARAAPLAAASRHPLARALVRAAEARGIAVGVVENVHEVPGRGLVLETPAGAFRLGSQAFIQAAGDATATAGSDSDTSSALWFQAPGETPHVFRFRDRLRADAGATVARLRRLGCGLTILSGDRPGPVGAVAQALGITDARASLLPAAKQDALAALASKGARVLMVGDGLNDAPALAAAHVSMSPSAAADISRTAADLVFQGEGLAPVADAVAVAHRARRLIRQNLAFSFLYNAVAVPLALFGYVTPLIAAVAMSSSSLIVILNALRLARQGRGQLAVATAASGPAGAPSAGGVQPRPA